jgi:hypothetical protein
MTKLAPAVSPKFGTTAASVAEVEVLAMVVVMHARDKKLFVQTKAVTSWQHRSSSSRSQAAHIAAAAAHTHTRLPQAQLQPLTAPSCSAFVMISIIFAAFVCGGAMLYAAETFANTPLMQLRPPAQGVLITWDMHIGRSAAYIAEHHEEEEIAHVEGFDPECSSCVLEKQRLQKLLRRPGGCWL